MSESLLTPAFFASLAIAVGLAAGLTAHAMRTLAADSPSRRHRALRIAIAAAALGTVGVAVGEPGRIAAMQCVVAGLLGFLAAAIATDWDCYLIPDSVALTGTVAGVTAMAAVGSPLHPLHAKLRPTADGWITAAPEWTAAHPHWHGLAVAVAGGLTGLLATLALRAIASAAMGREAMGTGDATLMMMAGTILGWQGSLLALLAAPLVGLAAALIVWATTRRVFVAFGPYLAVSSWQLLATWSDLWGVDRPTTVAQVFADLPLVAGTVVFILGGTGGLLWLSRRMRGEATQESDTNRRKRRRKR